MKRFYEIEKGGVRRFYTNLNKLCEVEKLPYTNVHYEISRKDADEWKEGDITVRRQVFSDRKVEE